MWVMFFSSALVSIDALFIGVSFGSQKKVKFWQVVFINLFLFLCCVAGFFIARAFFDLIDFEIDIIIGVLFILLGAWVIANHYIGVYKGKRKAEREHAVNAVNNNDPTHQDNNTGDSIIESDAVNAVNNNIPIPAQSNGDIKNIIMTGLFMSVEAMFITVGVILILGVISFWVAVFVGLMHFVYSSITFFLAKYLRKLPPSAGAIISGAALIVYGIMALVL